MPVPHPTADNYEKARIDGFENIRYWGNQPATYLVTAIRRLDTNLRNNPSLSERLDILALSVSRSC